MPLHLNKLPELALPQNALLDFKPIERVADSWEKQRQFDETKKLEREKLDMQRSHLGIAQGKADEERKRAQIEEWGRVASVIDETKDPAQRQAMWGKFVSSHPQFPSVFQKYGVDPNDHVNGPKFLRSQAGLYDPQKERETQARLGLANAQTNLYNSRAEHERFKADAERETAEATKREMEDYVLGPDGNLGLRRRNPKKAMPETEMQPPASAPPTAQPSSRIGKFAMMPGNPNAQPSMVEPVQGRASRDERNAATVQELAPIVQPNKPAGSTDENGNLIPSEAQIQRYWTGVYGQKAPSGSKYKRDGTLENMAEGKDNSRLAVRGALASASDNIQDARELLSKTNMLDRTAGHYTGMGNMANAQRLLNIGIRGILHGISGAQINIPEQQEYFNSFKPGPFEKQETMLSKLGHLENTLAHIRKFTDRGAVTDADVLVIRNSMRSAMGLPPLTMEEAKTRFQDREKKPQQPMQRPNAAPAPKGVPEGWGIKRIE